MRVTPDQLAVLRRLRDSGGLSSGSVASAKYPSGKGYAERWAKSMLDRLKKRGYVWMVRDNFRGPLWRVTAEGKKIADQGGA